MKTNKKGFTLIELLAVIVILAIIALIATPIVLNLIKRARLGAAQDSAYGLRKAAQLYYATSLTNDPNFSGATFECSNDGCIYEYIVGEETKTEKLDIDGTKPSHGTVTIAANGTITYSNIKYNNGAYTCNVPESGTIKCEEGDEVPTIDPEPTPEPEPVKVYENGEVVYYNPVEGKACTESQYNTDLESYKTTNSVTTPTGQNTGCMKWYAFNDSAGSTKVKLLLDHNTTANVAYNSEASSESYDGTCKEACTQLTTDTSNWKVNAENAEMIRMITADEIAQITGNTSFSAATSTWADGWFYLDSKNQTDAANATNKSVYAWLFDYTGGSTNDCTTYGCNIADSSTYGYWTSTPVAGNSHRVWYVGSYGDLGSDNAYNASYGIRPVIIVAKSIFS